MNDDSFSIIIGIRQFDKTLLIDSMLKRLYPERFFSRVGQVNLQGRSRCGPKAEC